MHTLPQVSNRLGWNVLADKFKLELDQSLCDGRMLRDMLVKIWAAVRLQDRLFMEEVFLDLTFEASEGIDTQQCPAFPEGQFDIGKQIKYRLMLLVDLLVPR